MLIAIALPIYAQVAPLAFEVATVKPTAYDGGVDGGCHGTDSHYTSEELATAPPLGRCVIRSGRLSHLVFTAYSLRSMQFFKSNPDWVAMGDERFDVEAKAEDPAHTTEAQLLEMLQNLLTDRFQMKFHRETKEVAGFALVVAKNGPKFRENTDPAAETRESGTFKAQPASFKFQKYSMRGFAELLSRIGRGPVSDETGLKGAYDFKLTWDDANGPSLFTALSEQLGLKLESRKLPVSIFVVDSARRPAQN